MLQSIFLLSSVTRFLIIQTAFLGDVVLATALVEKLHDSFPDVEIDFLLRKGNESILANNPKLHKVHVWDKSSKKFSNLLKVATAVRRQRYDCVINVHRGVNSGFITWFHPTAPFVSEVICEPAKRLNPVELFG